MTTIAGLRFPWGRYHATPWGHSVNEAVVEWPPSPWRILRALYCTWRFRAPDLPEGEVHRLLAELATPPSYALPPHLEAHTRHYMPDIAGGSDKVFDPFVVTARGAEVLVQWDVSLDSTAAATLETLLDLLPYLGRAESVCEGRLLHDTLPDTAWVRPGCDGADDSVARTRLLVAEEPLDLSALVMSTTAIRQAGRIAPPSTRWVSYVAPASSPRPRAPSRFVRRSPEAVRFAVDAPTPPSVRSAVACADLLRRAAMSAYGTPPSHVLAGKDRDGVPLRDHMHAHYLALDLDGNQCLDHLVVWAPGGLGPDEVRALAGLRRLSTSQPIGGFGPLRLTVESMGATPAVVPELTGPARIWASMTPFAPPRHQARRHDYESFVVAEVSRELVSRGLPPADVEPITGEWLAFRRRRLAEQLGQDRRAIGLRLRFREPVTGPLCLGSLSHFGLGLFVPA